MRQNGMMLDYLEGSAEEDMKKWDAVREKRAAVRGQGCPPGRCPPGRCPPGRCPHGRFPPGRLASVRVAVRAALTSHAHGRLHLVQ